MRTAQDIVKQTCHELESAQNIDDVRVSLSVMNMEFKKEKLRLRNAAYYASHAETRRAHVNAYYQENITMMQERNRARYARKKLAREVDAMLSKNVSVVT